MVDFQVSRDPEAPGKWRIIGTNEVSHYVVFELGGLDKQYANEYAAELNGEQYDENG